ncbi:restriction endonuclease subunit S [Pseudoxanthomonas koreensis]|uniref:restriction endonuclease subunit S n=1 Tax=Pseudoxanthomonas koreensis TaxID=266061 RepID=UPI0035A6DF6E
MSPLESVRLSSVAEIVQGGRLKLSGNDFVDAGFPAYGAGGLNGYLEVAEFNRPAIVLSSIGARCGKCFYVEGEWTSLANTQLIFPDLGKVDPKYLWYQLNDEGSWVRSGTAQPFIKPSNVKSRLVKLPELAEQRRIAAILDKADALRVKRREAIAKLDQLLQSVFLEMFGDPVANPKGWEKTCLSELFEIARGGSPRPIDDYITDAPDGINWIMIGDTVEGSKYITGTRRRIKPEGAKRSRAVKPGDFLLTNSMSFGRPYILRTSGCIHDGWLVLSPKAAKTNADYVFSVLSSPSLYAEFARRAPGATVKNLNIELVSGVEIPVPDLSLQAEFSRRVAMIESAQSKQLNALVDVDLLFNSVQAQVFSAGM